MTAFNEYGTNWGINQTFVASALPSPTLLAPWFQNGRFSPGIQTVLGCSYILESEDQLGSTNWTVVSSVPGDGTVRLLTDPSTNAIQRFYRVRVIQAQ